jgi:hypothetical protein
MISLQFVYGATSYIFEVINGVDKPRVVLYEQNDNVIHHTSHRDAIFCVVS